MNYLIIFPDKSCFYTNWYEFDNNYIDGMIVIDLLKHEISFNGKDFKEIKQDHL